MEHWKKFFSQIYALEDIETIKRLIAVEETKNIYFCDFINNFRERIEIALSNRIHGLKKLMYESQ